MSEEEILQMIKTRLSINAEINNIYSIESYCDGKDIYRDQLTIQLLFDSEAIKEVSVLI